MSRSYIKTELFRPSLHYPTHPYGDILARTAGRFPENTAVVSHDVDLSYRELDALVNSFANARVGAIASPINPAYKEREIAYQLDNSEAVAIVVQHELLPRVQAVSNQTPTLKHVITVGSDEQSA